jgi:hypothetical protein
MVMGIDLRSAAAALALICASVSAAAATFSAQWTQKAPLEPFLSATSPGPRSWTNLFYDSQNNRIAVFGGSAGARFVGDVWHYNAGADTWAPFDIPADDCPGTFGFSGPDGRDAQTSDYDAHNHLYWTVGGGGYKCTGTKAITRSAQAGTTTTQIVDATLPGNVPVDHYKWWSVIANSKVVYVTGYNPATRTLTLASPITGLAAGTSYTLRVWTNGGTWYFSPVTHEWRQLENPYYGHATPIPVNVETPAFVYSTTGKAMVRFGGSSNGNTRNDTWVLDVQTKTWVLKHANGAAGLPIKRSEITSAMVYDSKHDVFILFGGRCDGADPRCPGGHAPLNDTWVYKLSTNTWTQMLPPISPPARMSHQMAFDAEHGVVVMFGGTTVQDLYTVVPTVATTPRDTWVYDYATNTWSEVTPAVSPPGRYIGSMAYDRAAKVGVLYGGTEPGAGPPDGRIWHLKLTNTTGSNLSPNAVANVSPASGTTATVFAFDGSASNDSDGSIVSYQWNFGDGSSAGGATTTHQYALGGSYTATLVVTDNQGATGVQSRTISVAGTDSTPNAFSFAPVSGAALNTVVTSASATIGGIDTAAPVTISGGEYSINNGAFTSAAGSINNGQTVRVRLTSASTTNTQRSATLTIGGVAASFVVTTQTTAGGPSPFSFVPVTGVSLNTLTTSTTTTIGGLSAAKPISITGGEYSINNGAFTSAAGTISNGQGVRVRLTSSANYATTTTATVTIGEVSGSFAVTTYAEDTTPDAVSFTAVSNAALNTLVTSNPVTVWGVNAPTPISIVGGEYNINSGAYTSAAGTVLKGQVVRVRLQSAATHATQKTATLALGGNSVPFNVTTAAMDTTPNAFSYAAVSNAALNSSITSASVTIGGINAPAPVSISGGQYSIAGGAYTSAAGTISNGQSLRVRLTSAATHSTTTSATVTVGGVSAAFSVTTAAVDTTPNAFSFAPNTTAMPNAVVTSGAVTISGINAAAPISVAGGEYSIAGGAYTSAPGSITNGQTVRVRLTASPAYSTQKTATLTIGGVNGQFAVTTVAADTTPSPFAFAPVTGAPPSTAVTSTTTTIGGLNAPTPISISGGEYSINNGPFTSAAGTILNGQGVRVRLTSSASGSTTTSATVTIGGVSAAFEVTTRDE